MAKASTLDQREFVKMLYVGTSGTGKTGSLASLVAAGYKLRVLDLDNGVGTLINYVKKYSPELLDNIDVIACRDKLKADPARAITLTAVPGNPNSAQSACSS